MEAVVVQLLDERGQARVLEMTREHLLPSASKTSAATDVVLVRAGAGALRD